MSDFFKDVFKNVGAIIKSNNYLLCCDYQRKLIAQFLGDISIDSALMELDESFTIEDDYKELNLRFSNLNTRQIDDFEYKHNLDIGNGNSKLEIVLKKGNIFDINTETLVNKYVCGKYNAVYNEILNRESPKISDDITNKLKTFQASTFEIKVLI